MPGALIGILLGDAKALDKHPRLTGESFGRTIQLFLVDGKLTGLRKVPPVHSCAVGTLRK
jgi:hypothetical protein